MSKKMNDRFFRFLSRSENKSQSVSPLFLTKKLSLNPWIRYIRLIDYKKYLCCNLIETKECSKLIVTFGNA